MVHDVSWKLLEARGHEVAPEMMADGVTGEVENFRLMVHKFNRWLKTSVPWLFELSHLRLRRVGPSKSASEALRRSRRP